jgi:hypothetical protein
MKLKRKKLPEPPGRRRPADKRISSGAFSYYSQRSQSVERSRRRSAVEPNEPPKRDWSHYWSFAKQRFGLIIVTIVAIICVINALRLNSVANVESLNGASKGYLLHSKQEYEASVHDLLDKSILNGNKLTVNTAKFEAEMKARYPELSSVEVALPLAGHRPTVYIRISEPSFVLVGSNSQSFVIDENGVALIPTVNVPNLNELDLPVIKDESGLELEQGKTILSSSSVSFISIILAQLKASNVPVSRLVLPTAASELDAFIAGKSYYVKFNLNSKNPTQEVGSYIATAKHLQKQGANPKEYIDVRVEGRAYYR